MRSVELPKNTARGVSAEARRRSLSMTVSLSGSPMEVRSSCMWPLEITYRPDLTTPLSSSVSSHQMLAACIRGGDDLYCKVLGSP